MSEQILLPGHDMPEIRSGFVYLRYDPVKRDWNQVIEAFLKNNQWFDHSQKTIVCIPLGGDIAAW